LLRAAGSPLLAVLAARTRNTPSSFVRAVLFHQAPTTRPEPWRPRLSWDLGLEPEAGPAHARMGVPPARHRPKASAALAKKAAPAPSAGYQGAGTLRAGPGEGGNPHALSTLQKAGRRHLPESRSKFGRDGMWPAHGVTAIQTPVRASLSARASLAMRLVTTNSGYRGYLARPLPKSLTPD
jgi:hypothetical protein